MTFCEDSVGSKTKAESPRKGISNGGVIGYWGVDGRILKSRVRCNARMIKSQVRGSDDNQIKSEPRIIYSLLRSLFFGLSEKKLKFAV